MSTISTLIALLLEITLYIIVVSFIILEIIIVILVLYAIIKSYSISSLNKLQTMTYFLSTSPDDTMFKIIGFVLAIVILFYLSSRKSKKRR